MKDVMIDTETMGMPPKGAVVQLSGSYFDRYSGELGKKFNVYIPLEEEVANGYTMDPSVVLWWLNQSKEAQNSVLFNDTIYDSIGDWDDFYEFLKSAECIWCHTTFDYPLVAEHLKSKNFHMTHFRKFRDIRTLIDLSGIDYKSYPRVGIAHNALDDCLFQIKYCVDAFNKLEQR